MALLELAQELEKRVFTRGFENERNRQVALLCTLFKTHVVFPEQSLYVRTAYRIRGVDAFTLDLQRNLMRVPFPISTAHVDAVIEVLEKQWRDSYLLENGSEALSTRAYEREQAFYEAVSDMHSALIQACIDAQAHCGWQEIIPINKARAVERMESQTFFDWKQHGRYASLELEGSTRVQWREFAWDELEYNRRETAFYEEEDALYMLHYLCTGAFPSEIRDDSSTKRAIERRVFEANTGEALPIAWSQETIKLLAAQYRYLMRLE